MTSKRQTDTSETQTDMPGPEAPPPETVAVATTRSIELTQVATRREHDLLGEVNVPAQAYWGVHTLRAVENFPITGVPVGHFPEFVKALALVKQAAARANRRLGHLSADKADMIDRACDLIVREGRHHDQFVVDVIQGGAGTSTNMNTNEVVANVALELMGRPKGDYAALHPNDDVNMAQSTNDAYPTALRLVLQPGFAGCPSCGGGAKPCRVGAKPRIGLRSWRRLPGGLPRGSGVRSRADAPWLIFRACWPPWSGRTAGTSPRRPATTRQMACRSSSRAFTGTPMRSAMICGPMWSSTWVMTTRSWCWMRRAFSRRAPSRPGSTASTPARQGASRTARSAFSLATPAAVVGR